MGWKCFDSRILAAICSSFGVVRCSGVRFVVEIAGSGGWISSVVDQSSLGRLDVGVEVAMGVLLGGEEPLDCEDGSCGCVRR